MDLEKSARPFKAVEDFKSRLAVYILFIYIFLYNLSSATDCLRVTFAYKDSLPGSFEPSL